MEKAAKETGVRSQVRGGDRATERTLWEGPHKGRVRMNWGSESEGP